MLQTEILALRRPVERYDAPKTKPKKQSTYEVGPDIARMVGSVAIVWFHIAETWHQDAYFALPLFAVLSLAFVKPSFQGRYIRVRTRRVLVPWLMWSSIYGLLKTVEAIMGGGYSLDWWRWDMVLTGTSLHLWFLPAIFVIGCLGLQINNLGISKFNTPIKIAIAGLLALLTIQFLCEPGSIVPPPIGQWISIIPAAIMGIFAAAIRVRSKRDASKFLIFAGILLMISFHIDLTADQPTAVGLLISGICLSFPRINWNQNWAVDISFLIYLIHPLVAAMIKRMIHSGDRGDLLAVLTILFSLAVAGAIFVSPLKRWLI